MKTLLAVPIVLVALISGCSKGSGDGVASLRGTQAPSSAPAADPQERVHQFVTCMRAEGVDVPDPEPGDTTGKSALRFDAGTTDKEKVRAALEKCNAYLPSGGQPPRPPTAEELAQLQAFAQCMRKNGVANWPDPDPQSGFKGGPDPGIDKNDPAVVAANEKCRPNL